MKLFQCPLGSATMDDLEKDDFVEGCVISLRELRRWMAM
jgi:hypothetical protein